MNEKDQILSAIKAYKTIIIHRHVRPDPDAYGSQGGLAELLSESFPEKDIFIVGNDEKSLMFLKEMDHISEATYKGALVIVCDTANQERICDQRYNQGDMLIKIDHHPNEDPYGDLLWVDTEASPVSEMIYEFYLHGKNEGLILNKKAAELIYAGIIGDTGRFLFPSTNIKTFHYGGELVKHGVDFPKVHENLYKMTAQLARLQGYIYQNYYYSNDGVASVSITKDLLEEYEVSISDASTLVGSLGSIEGIVAWVFFIEEEDQIRVRLRSKRPVVNMLAKKYRGGGHPLAAGASVYSWEETEHVLADLKSLVNKKQA